VLPPRPSQKKLPTLKSPSPEFAKPNRGDFAEKEIPQSISVITTKQLEDNNILRLIDALDLNASVTRQNNFGGLWDSFAIRGFSGDENLPSGYLVNGFNGGRGFGGTRDVAGVERIEVLKGLAAALFGRGEPGGTVNIVTKRAEFGNFKGSASGLYGSFNRIRFDADANIPVGENVAIRLVGYSEKADSFRDTVNSKRHGFLPSVLVRLVKIRRSVTIWNMPRRKLISIAGCWRSTTSSA
jgi:iron complex outermembrane recepter protein